MKFNLYCVPACVGCNSSKHESTLNEWYKEQIFFSRERYLKIYVWLRYEANNVAKLKMEQYKKSKKKKS